MLPLRFSSSSRPYSGTQPVMAAHSALLALSRLERAPQTELTYGVALDSEKAQTSPKFGTFVAM